MSIFHEVLKLVLVAFSLVGVMAPVPRWMIYNQNTTPIVCCWIIVVSISFLCAINKSIIYIGYDLN